MKHADWLMNASSCSTACQPARPGQAASGRGCPEILACDLRSEQGAQATIKEGMAHCESVRDYVSRDLLQRFWTTPKSTSTFWKPRSTSSKRWVCQNYLQSQMGMLTEGGCHPSGRAASRRAMKQTCGPVFFVCTRRPAHSPTRIGLLQPCANASRTLQTK